MHTDRVKIYTKTGDDGTTGLFGGGRVGKDNVRVEAYGTVDELNAILGVAAGLIEDEEIKSVVCRLQSELFVVGSDLATHPFAKTPNAAAIIAGAPRVTSDMTLQLEAEIDRYSAEAGPLMHFILPGGSRGGAALHQARCVCRRAERIITLLGRTEEINPQVLPYMNRLSDHLFELARLANHRAGAPETIWSRETAKQQ